MAEKKNPPRPFDEIYLSIWKVEQEHTRTRWTVTTFFFGISFAIFGFSFQMNTSDSIVIHNIQRFVALIIYWFAFLLYLQYQKFNHYLRSELKEMEKNDQVTLRIQTNSQKFMGREGNNLISGTKLLLYFGVLYTLASTIFALISI